MTPPSTVFTIAEGPCCLCHPPKDFCVQEGVFESAICQVFWDGKIWQRYTGGDRPPRFQIPLPLFDCVYVNIIPYHTMHHFLSISSLEVLSKSKLWLSSPSLGPSSHFQPAMVRNGDRTGTWKTMYAMNKVNKVNKCTRESNGTRIPRHFLLSLSTSFLSWLFSGVRIRTWRKIAAKFLSAILYDSKLVQFCGKSSKTSSSQIFNAKHPHKLNQKKNWIKVNYELICFLIPDWNPGWPGNNRLCVYSLDWSDSLIWCLNTCKMFYFEMSDRKSLRSIFWEAMRKSTCLPSNSSHERTLVELLGRRMSTATRSSTCTTGDRLIHLWHDRFLQQKKLIPNDAIMQRLQTKVPLQNLYEPSSVSPNAVLTSVSMATKYC